jgi:uncharacterized protein DUF2442/uncharacterized protein DUF4160
LPRLSSFYGIVIAMYHREHGRPHFHAGYAEHRATIAIDTLGSSPVRLSFEDGTQGEVDFATWDWRGVFEPLHDPDYFASVVVDEELGTIVWPNGADVAPETLHAWVRSGREPQTA